MDNNQDIINQTEQREKEMRVVGYCLFWRMAKLKQIQFENLTHFVYAFIIPNKDGTVRPLQTPNFAKAIIKKAHEKGVKVLLGCGGWSDGDDLLPVEAVFKAATDTDLKIRILVKGLMDIVKEYQFDGIEISWLHPRYMDASQTQYEKLIQELHKELKPQNLLLTTCILSGVNVDGLPMYDAPAYTEQSWNYVDWVSVIAYDGGDGEKHAPFEFMVKACEYWRDTRGIPADKIIAGIPFYGRPTCSAYFEILEFDHDADQKDMVVIRGKDTYYNGKETVVKKAKWAKENIGGISLWELTHDSADKEKSLLTAIADALK